MRRSHTISTTLTISASPMKNQRCQPPASCSRLKAAPSFSQVHDVENRQQRNTGLPLDGDRPPAPWWPGPAARRKTTTTSQLLAPRVGVNQTFDEADCAHATACSPVIR